jgi:hypothetical protein
MSRVSIQGDGVAAWCCALLLRRAGFEVGFQATPRPRLPAIMLGDAAVAMMRDVFERDDLFRDATRVSKRVVAWGAEPVALDHNAVVVSEQQLLEGLGIDASGGEGPGWRPDWTVIASRPLPVEVAENCFGSRFATATPVELNADAEPEACWMESVEGGWMFLITDAPGAGWMLSVGAAAGELMERSCVVARQIAQAGPAMGSFPASPRILSPLCGAGWLACGTAAMAFDPICGDGTAHAIREAILGAAVVRAASVGGDAPSLLAHYEGRMTAGFRKHLESCLGFYQSGGPDGGNDAWWQGEADALRRGIKWCDAKLGPNPAFEYRLSGFELQRQNAAK